jgi:hypothetical protein
MSKSHHYRENAFDCVRLAQRSDSGSIKLVLLMMARGWIEMGKLSAGRLSANEVATTSKSGVEIGNAVGF